VSRKQQDAITDPPIDLDSAPFQEVQQPAINPAAANTPIPGVAPATRKNRVVRPMDAELQTMARIDRLLSEHDESGQARILAWVLARKSKMVAITAVNGQTTNVGNPYSEPVK
jgi:multidrug efflux pump subunit AcrB